MQNKFEHFTDRSQNSMRLAVQEAALFRHTKVDPIHVLLGLIKERAGVAGHVLIEKFDLDLDSARVEVRRVRPPGVLADEQTPEHSDAIDALVEKIREEAAALRHKYVGTEHVLLGLLALHDADIEKVLTAKDIDGNKIRQTVLQLLGIEPPSPDAEQTTSVPQPDSEDPIEDAFAELKNALARPNLSDLEALQAATETINSMEKPIT